MDIEGTAKSSATQNSGEASIAIGTLIHPKNVRCPEEDWTGITDPVRRKKLQNRMNQRLYRQRMAKIKRVGLQAKPDSSEETRFSNRRSTSFGKPVWMASFEAQARYDYAAGSPRADQLLTLIHVNVLRALLSNTAALGFGEEWFSSEDAISPFVSPTPPAKTLQGPANLRPTALQQTVEHHPWIDLFPITKLRDNFLRAGDTFDESDLCNDLVDFHNITHEGTGLIAWNSPWEPSGWEASEAFLVKWSWLLEGCDDLAISTNYWRARRGEPALSFDFK